MVINSLTLALFQQLSYLHFQLEAMLGYKLVIGVRFMDNIAFDWLQQLEREAWERKIRELRRELNNERIQARQPDTALQEVASPITPERIQAQQPDTALQEVASPITPERPQKPLRLTQLQQRF